MTKLGDTMRHFLAAGLIALAGLGLAALPPSPSAQAGNEPAGTAAPVPAPAPATAANPASTGSREAAKPNPIGVGSAWQAEIQDGADVSGRTFSEAELEIIRAVNAYFNGITQLKGRFVQISADNEKARGRFFVQRPGKFRFVYAPPSRLVILSDGRHLSIEDHDLKTVDRFPLDSTPFRILLKEQVDILRDAQVIDIVDEGEEVSLTLVDKAGEGSGRIRLRFSKVPEFTLKAWTVTDAQGLDTRIEVADMALAEELEPSLFRGSKIGLPDGSASGN